MADIVQGSVAGKERQKAAVVEIEAQHWVAFSHVPSCVSKFPSEHLATVGTVLDTVTSIKIVEQGMVRN